MKNRHSSSARTAGFTLCSAMVAALLAGCAGGQPSVASAGGSHVADGSVTGIGEGVSDASLAKVEARVAKSPNDAVARAALAQGYLAAGRFDSAATTFEDALALGDRSPRTGLSLALAYVGSGRSAEARDVLVRFADKLPASDYGLALALAGQPAQGVTVLSEAVRGGENTPKMRQNLAYAYALDGRWAEARVIASQDVAGDDLDARMQEWAAGARPDARADAGRVRVAGLLGTPLRLDPGQPTALALNGVDHTPRAMMASAEPVAAPAELPPVQEVAPVYVAEAPAAPVAPVEPSGRSSIERAFDGSLAKMQKAPAPAKAAVERRAEASTHLVQLGSFRSMEGAKRAWGIFQKRDPSLRGHKLRIIEADVNGQRYYRVAAEGFGRSTAQSMCSTVKQRGQQCFAYADGRPMQGAIVPNGAQLARR